MSINLSTETKPTSTGNLRVCVCGRVADQGQLSECPTCNNFMCAWCDCVCPVSDVEAEAA